MPPRPPPAAAAAGAAGRNFGSRIFAISSREASRWALVLESVVLAGAAVIDVLSVLSSARYIPFSSPGALPPRPPRPPGAGSSPGGTAATTATAGGLILAFTRVRYERCNPRRYASTFTAGRSNSFQTPLRTVLNNSTGE